MNIQNQVLRRLFKFRVFILVIVILFLLTLEFASGRSASQRPERRLANQQSNPIQSAMSNFQSSLEMKENVDFLLTPALLVQEAISEDVVITYPSE